MWMIHSLAHTTHRRSDTTMNSNTEFESNRSNDTRGAYALMPYLGAYNNKYMNKREIFDASQISENVARGKGKFCFIAMNRSDYGMACSPEWSNIKVMENEPIGMWEKSSSLATFDEAGNVIIIDGCLRASRLFDWGAAEVPVCLVEREDALTARRFGETPAQRKILSRRERTHIGDARKGDGQVRWGYDFYEFYPPEGKGRRQPDISEMHVEYLLGIAGTEITKKATKLSAEALRRLPSRTIDPKSDAFLSGLYLKEGDETVTAAAAIGPGAFMNKKNKLKAKLKNSDLDEITKIQNEIIKNNEIEENIFIYVCLSRLLVRMKSNRSFAISQESHGGTYEEKNELLAEIADCNLSLLLVRKIARMTGINVATEYNEYLNHYDWIELNRLIFFARRRSALSEMSLQLAYCYDLWYRDASEEAKIKMENGSNSLCLRSKEMAIIADLDLDRSDLGPVSALRYYSAVARYIIEQAYMPVESYPGLIETARKIGVI